MAVCRIDGCGKKVSCRGLCSMHRMRLERHGDPLAKSESKSLAFLRDVALPSRTDACIPWPFALTRNGYPKLFVRGKTKEGHRLVCEMTHGPSASAEMQSAHECGNRRCVNPAHISWKTRAENAADRLVHGTIARGEKMGTAKLTREDVLQIRAIGRSLTQKEVAKRFGVAPGHIGAILSGRCWGWFDGASP